jgi:signal transduction histidine kinase
MRSNPDRTIHSYPGRVAQNVLRSGREKMNILMVDDQDDKLLTYEAILAPLGENLIKARCADEALCCLLTTNIAVVLLDVSMPVIDGFQLAEMIRSHPRFGTTAIIFISAVHRTDLDRLRGFEHGGVDYISVPIIPELLRARVKVFAESHRKTRQLESLNRTMGELSNRMTAMQDDERRRIARELHDGLGQELTAAKLTNDGIQNTSDLSEAKARAAEVGALVEGAITQVRSISHLLHPPLLDEAGLRFAVQWYLEGLTKRCGIRTYLEVKPANFPRLPEDLEIALYRIVQEALTNIFRHSGAGHAWVVLACDENQVRISVRDDGKGIPDKVLALQPGSAGVGIAGMRQRLSELHGELRLENANPGALVKVLVPLGRTRTANAA